jgi:polysaccharide pyruvyl transferase WcaK-like protein
MFEKIKILLHASYYSPNFGDVLLWHTTLNLVKQAYPNSEVMRANLPDDLQCVYDSRMETRALAPLEATDLTVFAGGGYFCPPAAGKLKWHARNYFKRHRKALKAAAASKKVAFIGVGFGDLGRSFMAHAVRSIPTDRVSLALLRDGESLEYFKDYCQVPNAGICDDLAFSYLSGTGGQRHQVEADPDLLGIHMGAATANMPYHKLFLATLAELKKRNNWRYRIFVDCDNAKARACLPMIKEIIGSDCEIVVFKDNLSAFLDSLSECGLVMTTKLHVGICASAMSVPVLSTPAHIKTARFYRKINLEQAVVQSAEASAQMAITNRSRLLADKSVLIAAGMEFNAISKMLAEAGPDRILAADLQPLKS